MPSMKLGDTALIVAECRKRGLLRNQCAYVLATAYHETAHTMKPVRETLAKSDAQAKAVLSRAWKTGKLRQVKRDYWSDGWFGRGYVQLTHEKNYAKAGKALGVDLVGNPGLALEPTIAAKILVDGMTKGMFTGKKLSDYINENKVDYRGARRIVNGTDRAADIAKYAVTFEAALRVAGYVALAPVAAPPAPAKPVDTPKPQPVPQPVPVPPVASKPARKSPAAAIIAAVLAIAAAAIAYFTKG